MKKRSVIILAIVIFLVTASIVSLVYQYEQGYLFSHVQEMPYLFYVNQTPGIDVRHDILRMGQIAWGARTTREVTISDPGAHTVLIRVFGKGAGILYADPSELNLTNGTANVTFIAEAAPDTPYGRYDGVVRFYFH